MVIAVPVGPGDQMTVRLPSPAERQAYQLAEEGPALEIRRATGVIEIIDVDLAEVVFVPSKPESGTAPAERPQQQIEEGAQRD